MKIAILLFGFIGLAINIALDIRFAILSAIVACILTVCVAHDKKKIVVGILTCLLLSPIAGFMYLSWHPDNNNDDSEEDK